MPSNDYSNINPLDCHGDRVQCPVQASIYGYTPDLASTIFFVLLFAICGTINIIWGLRYRTWSYMTAVVLGCLSMTIGYAGRIVLHYNPFDQIGFEIQICCLTIAPAFNAAAIYLILKHLVRYIGRQYSRINPRFYTWIFITADIIALSLQGAGGGVASTADTSATRQIGNGLMLAGICWQVFTLTFFAIAAVDIVGKYLRKRRFSNQDQQDVYGHKFLLFLLGYIVAFITIFTRSVYRIVEMSGGWQNPVMQNQGLFIALDSVMAVLCQTFLHPGYLFPYIRQQDSKEEEGVQHERETIYEPVDPTVKQY